MKEKSLSDHRNYKYTMIDKYNCKFRKATKEEIQKARKKYRTFMKKAKPEDICLRSCYECNQAHGHLMKDIIINCLWCGKIFVDGIDIMDYSE
jgi:hypothetical protein